MREHITRMTLIVVKVAYDAEAGETPFTVPVNIDSRHTANKVLKDAGLPKAF